MEWATGIGIVASVLTALSLVPQLVKLCREKKPQNVSMGMLSVLLAGLVLWIVYGAMRDDWIIIGANSFSLAMNVTTIVLAHRYRSPVSGTSAEKNADRLRRHYP